MAVNVFISNYEGEQGVTSFEVAVEIGSVAGETPITSLDLRIGYDSSLLTATSVNKTGNLLDGWSDSSNLGTAGEVLYSAFDPSFQGISNSGVLFRILFTLNAEGTSALSFISALLNEGDPVVSTASGILQIGVPGIGIEVEPQTIVGVQSGLTADIKLLDSTVGENILSATIEIEFDSTVIDITDIVETVETSLSGSVISFNTPYLGDPNKAILSWAAAVPFESDNGDAIFEIQYDTLAVGNSPITFNRVEWNEGTPSSHSTDGSVNVISTQASTLTITDSHTSSDSISLTNGIATSIQIEDSHTSSTSILAQILLATAIAITSICSSSTSLYANNNAIIASIIQITDSHSSSDSILTTQSNPATTLTISESHPSSTSLTGTMLVATTMAISESAFSIGRPKLTNCYPAASYNIYRSFNGVNFTFLANTVNLSYVDNSLSVGQTAFYYVTALDITGNESTPSAVVSQTVGAEATSITITDTVTSSDSISLALPEASTITITDSHVSSDSLSLTNAATSITIEDTTTSSDNISLFNAIANSITIDDSHVSSDSIALSVPLASEITITDSHVSSDTISVFNPISTTITISDSHVSSDVINLTVPVANSVTIDDSHVSSDSITVFNPVATTITIEDSHVSSTAITVDNIIEAETIVITDSHTSSDSITVFNPISTTIVIEDSHVSSDAISLIVPIATSITIEDSHVSSDAISLAVPFASSMTIADSHVSSDNIVVTAPLATSITIADSHVSSDSITLTVPVAQTITIADSHVSSDTISLNAPVAASITIEDSHVSSDSITVQNAALTIAITDSHGSTDAISLDNSPTGGNATISSIQFIYTTIPASPTAETTGDNSGTITIPTAVNTANTMIITQCRNPNNTRRGVAAFELTDSTTITYHRRDTRSNLEVNIHVIEWDSSVNVQHFYFSNEDGANTGVGDLDQTITSVDPTKTLVFMSVNSADGNSTGRNRNTLWGALITSATNLRLFRPWGASGDNSHIGVQVVEFPTGTVQSGTISIAEADLTADETITAVSDTANTFIHFSFSANNGDNRDSACYPDLYLTSTTNLRVEKIDNVVGQGEMEIYYQVAEIPNWNVQRVEHEFTGGGNTETETISTVDVDNAWVTGYRSGFGGQCYSGLDPNNLGTNSNNANRTMHCLNEIDNATTLNFYRTTPTFNARYTAYVVEVT